MKIDLYIKIVLTVIAIGVAIPLLTNPPVINNANASNDRIGMIATANNNNVWQLKNGKVRMCSYVKYLKPNCSPWSD